MEIDFEFKRKVLKYYYRKDVQEAIFKEAQGKELGVKTLKGYFMKRPDALFSPGDLWSFVKNNAVSFHISEETWIDPMEISSSKSLDEIRKGWDLIIDIDGDFKISQICAKWVLKFLSFYKIENIGLKFSGNKGFHIAIPFEDFPEKVNGKDTRLLFPQAPQKVIKYISKSIQDNVLKEVKEKFSEDELKEIYYKTHQKTQKFNLEFKEFVELDTILISSRHLFRAPYSIHEKSKLVSIPIDKNSIETFKKEDAKIENVNTSLSFIDRNKSISASARRLFIDSFDQVEEKDNTIISLDINKNIPKNTKSSGIEKEILEKIKNIPNETLKSDYFPPCIQKALDTNIVDGKKRTIFILINFFKTLDYTNEHIANMLIKWNKNQKEPLNEKYILTQLNYLLKNPLTPPKCSNDNYYQAIGICEKNPFCSKISNPLQYFLRKLQLLSKTKKTRKKTTKNIKNKKENQNNKKQDL
jgi:DNA primase large subunit